MTDLVAIVLAAGTGTRMRSRIPKVMHTVAGKPMLRCVLDALTEAGIERRIVVLGPASEPAREIISAGTEVAFQAMPRGTADAVRAAALLCQGYSEILVLNGDVPLIRPETLRTLLRRHAETRAAVSVLTAAVADPSGLGRIKRGASGEILAIVEERDAPADLLAVNEINAGFYCFAGDWLWPHLQRVQPSPTNGEFYLTELVRMAVEAGDQVTGVGAAPDEALGINSRAELAAAEALARQRIRSTLLDSGVRLLDPATVYVDFDVQIGQDSVIYPNTSISAGTVIGEECEIGPNSIIHASRIGNRCRIVASVVEEALVEDEVGIGPFSHLRPGVSIGRGAILGNYAEVKQSRIGPRTQMHHFSYIGDATVGADVNIGAGTITCNFDGRDKHQTRIGEGAFIGSDTMLVAPVQVGDGGRTGAGSVVTRDVAAGETVIGVPARVLHPSPPVEPEVGNRT